MKKRLEDRVKEANKLLYDYMFEHVRFKKKDILNYIIQNAQINRVTSTKTVTQYLDELRDRDVLNFDHSTKEYVLDKSKFTPVSEFRKELQKHIRELKQETTSTDSQKAQ